MTKQLARVRRMIATHEPGRGRRYPAAVQEAVTSYALRRRAEDASWAVIAEELGMWFETVRRWCAKAEEAEGTGCGIVPVEVVEDRREGAVAIVSPSGFRLEGLEAAAAVAALKAIG